MDIQPSSKEVPLNNPFKWDGSFLGNITDSQIMQIFYYDNFEYWTIVHQGYATVCQVRKSKKYTQCLVDELKPLFGLIKIGTHYGNYKAGYVILLRARTTLSGDAIVADCMLSEAPNLSDSEISDRIKQIYVFRDLLCLTKSTDSTIALRVNDGANRVVYPLSLIDSSIDLERMSNHLMSTYLPETAFNKWLLNESPSLILQKMCNVYNRDSIMSRIDKLRTDILIITRRVCGHYFEDFVSVICNRLLSKLQYSGKVM